MQELRAMLCGLHEDIPLDVAALQLATIEYPEVSVEPFLELLESYAKEASEHLRPALRGIDFVETLNEFLFEELEFSGNEEDYYHPSNSCLNEVLTRRTGLPITLSVMYMEISRRLGRPMAGVGLPGHFVVRYTEDDCDLFIDPFHKGRLLTEEDCLELAASASGSLAPPSPEVLNPVSKRHVLIRMLNNLRAAYFHHDNPAKAIQVLDLLIEALPQSAQEYKQRGICHLQVKQMEQALRDFDEYLRLSPEAPDRVKILGRIAEIQQWLSAT